VALLLIGMRLSRLPAPVPAPRATTA